SSINHIFLNNIQLLLQTLGVQSKVLDGMPEDERLMPDGQGGYKLYSCKEIKRLLITSNGLYKLLKLGLKLNRLSVSTREPQREASQFVTIKNIIDIKRYDDTFCFSESKRQSGVFNGILTGQCQEIIHPVIPLNHIDDTKAEIGCCILSGIN